MRLTGRIAFAGGLVLLAGAVQAQTYTTKSQSVTTSSRVGNTTTYTTTTPRGSTITTKIENNPYVGTRTVTTTFEPAHKSGYDTSGGNKSTR